MITAYRIATPRLILRAYEPGDAARLKRALDESRDELAPWMSWARSLPRPLDDNIALCRRYRGLFDLDQEHHYAVLDRDEREQIGGVALHALAAPGAREIGYWLRTGWTGRGFATEMVGALARVAFEHGGWRHLEIHVNPANVRSAAIPRRLGFRRSGTVPDRTESRELERWVLEEAAPVASVAVEAWDAVGRGIRTSSPRAAPGWP